MHANLNVGNVSMEIIMMILEELDSLIMKKISRFLE
jgi:hypothetical protein